MELCLKHKTGHQTTHKKIVFPSFSWEVDSYSKLNLSHCSHSEINKMIFRDLRRMKVDLALEWLAAYNTDEICTERGLL